MDDELFSNNDSGAASDQFQQFLSLLGAQLWFLRIKICI
jgi:hypothetical protein